MSYRAGIIGSGGIAGTGILGMHDEEVIGTEKIRASHAGGYDATDNLELVAIADVEEERLATFGEAWDISPDSRYVGHESMLEAEELDVISVCTPSFLHDRHVIDSAQSAADPSVIWCEKPIASGVNAADQMIDVCDDTGTELLVNHSFRFTTKLQKLRRLVQEENILGDVRSVSAQFRMELLRNSTHLLDTLVYLLDTRADSVIGHITGENEAVESLDTATQVDDAGGGGVVVMDDGTFATIDCTVPREESSMLFSLIGSEGKLYLNNDDGEWRYWTLEDGTHVERELPGIDGSWTWERDYKESFANAATHIEGILDGTEENHSPGRAARQSLEIIVAFYLSHYTGGQIDIPLERPLRDVTITSW
jgi:predicted dehydrogenase